MKRTGVAVAIVLAMGALGTAPGHAQMQTPNINLLADGPSKTPDEIEAEQQRDRAYKDTLRKIPDAKISSDPWGSVRGAEQAKVPPAKTAASAKKSKAGSNPN